MFNYWGFRLAAPPWTRRAAAARSLCARGYFVMDGALGGGVASALASELSRLQPLMQQGRVGAGLESGAVRTDVLWRHRRGEGTVRRMSSLTPSDVLRRQNADALVTSTLP